MWHFERLGSRLVAVLCASLWVACSASRQKAPREYAQSRDSASNAALTNRALSRPQVGEKAPVVPPLRPARPPVAGPLAAAAAAAGQAVIDDSKSLDSELLKPGGFSLSPRYRYDPKTGEAAHIPREAVKELLSQGRGVELRGTLEPDIVIHGGKPHQVQAVYDYKFPCVNTGKWIEWRPYREGHVHEGSHQGELYKNALKIRPTRVQPHLGVKR